MVDRYALGVNGIEFAGQLTDSDNPYNLQPISLENNTRLYVKFRKPDGNTFEVEATARGSDLTDTEIVYHNTGDSILNQTGNWSYTIGAEFSDGIKVESVEHEIFWVI